MTNTSASISLSSTVQLHPEVLSRNVNGEELILSLKLGEYFGLNSVGGFIWTTLREPQIVSDVAQAVVAEYNVSAEVALADTLALLNDLVEKQLIVLS